jgi:hypothetical protein
MAVMNNPLARSYPVGAAFVALFATLALTAACISGATAQAEGLSWTFGSQPPPEGKHWTAERGTLTLANGEARLQPDANRRVVLVSPPDLPDAARGGWLTIADASGSALRETAEGYVVKRKPGARDAPIERLRIELQFRTTNPRVLQRIVVQ